jgi:hypothetical protein
LISPLGIANWFDQSIQLSMSKMEIETAKKYDAAKTLGLVTEARA